MFFVGCSEQLTLKNQIKNKKEYEKIFLNSSSSVTILYEKESGVLVAENITATGFKKIEFIIGGNEKYVTWNSYEPKPYSVWDVKVYIPDMKNIEAGEHNKGKFGTDKLQEL